MTMIRHKLKFEKAIENWDEAVPLGNGRIGTLIWGNADALRFSLDRTDVWDTSVPLNTEREDFTYAAMVNLAREGKTEEIRKLFDAPYNHPTPTKLPVGKIILRFAGGTAVESELDLERAEAKLKIRTEKETISLDAVCHAVTKSGMIRVRSAADSFEIKLENPRFGNSDQVSEESYDPEHRTISQGGLEKIHYAAPVLGKTEGNPAFFRFEQKVDEGYSFGIVLGVQRKDEETLAFYRVVTSDDRPDWMEAAEKELRQELEAGYEKCFRTHQAWWEQYWGKSSISLPDVLFEKQWYLANYLFASCSRKGEYPMPLQGVWTADNGELPPWKGDYHNDLNTQLSYSHFYKANHLEEGECFLDFLWDSMEAARKFAKTFYKTEGICLPGVMAIDGKPLGGWPMYSLSPTQQIWLCQSFELYYRYTGDMKFLKEKAWVYFEETAKCITGLLEEKDGYLYLPVSSSPEIHDDEKEAWVTPNSNYDLALLRYLYQTLIDFSIRLEYHQEYRWKQILEKLPQLAVNEKKVLMISPDESLEESHRHLSNAMAVCPLGLMNCDTDKEIIDATVLDFERLGTGMWVGFSFVWMSHLYSVQKNGEGAYEQLRIFWESFCSSNGFHLNGDYKKRGYTTFHYRPFTLESNMYAADALQEMLLSMRDGVIELFPAIPEKWKKERISFENLRGEKGLLISAEWIPDMGCEVSFMPKQDQTVYVGKREIDLYAGKITQIRLE
ncbi:MAG: glycoside hydrolase N-terminal domain-containing protein [Lachnospiraceae bacterium]|nr:glycoside hydrolase N-terminal domain-containing protein [Lachnospiraceae bacterium]